jgi:hypothetical protein
MGQGTQRRSHRWRCLGSSALAAVIAVTVAIAGCGHDSERASPAPRGASATSAPAGKPLLYVWRNFEETGIPDELTVYRDGRLRYRNLLHTQHTIKPIVGRLPGREVSELRRLVGRADLQHADASGVEPRRSGYRYVLRTRDRGGTAADGHLHGSLRRLVVQIRAIMDRLQTNSL